ncbi:TonB-dependent receptor [Litorivivens sp.]|uniref:TonB-dependent receptor n=2 Tax=Litorivivens sp. TaxID=2020868 RepID=UPI0035662F4D
MNFRKKSVWLLSSIVSLQLSGTAVQAQQAQAPKVARVDKSLEEIVVTARKREESIQDIPVSVTPFTADSLERRGFTGLDDIAAATPGFTYEGFITGGNHGNAVIRGLAQQFTTSRIQNVSFFIDGVYLQRQSMLNLGMIDMERVEVIKGPQNALFGRNAFAGAVNYITAKPKAEPEAYIAVTVGDNERQDVKASFNGPIALDGRLLAKATFGFSEYDGHTKNDHPMADADPTGPSTTGNLGGWDDEIYSLMLAYEPTDSLMLRTSYYKNNAEKETGAGYSISGVNAARFGLRLDNQLDLNCNWRTVNDIGNPSPTAAHSGYSAWCGELPTTAAGAEGPRTQDGILIDPRGIGQVATTEVITFTADYELNEGWTAHYLFGYADHETYSTGGPGGEDPLVGRGIAADFALNAANNQDPNGYKYANTFSGRPNSVLESFSHELRFDFDSGDRYRMSLGAYYSKTEDREHSTVFISDVCSPFTEEQRQNCSEPMSTPSSAVPDPGRLTTGIVYDQVTRQHANTRLEDTSFEDEIIALFFSTSYLVRDNIDMTFEGRLTHEDKYVFRHADPFGLAFGESVTYRLPEDPVVPGLADTVTSSIIVPEDDEQFLYFTPRGIVNWSLNDDQMVYFSVAKGLKTGGFNNAESKSQLVYDEATNWTYEIGSKNKLLDAALTLNGALFYIDWTGLQGSVPPQEASLSSSDVVTNIGNATSLGIELEAAYRFNRNVSVDVGLTYNDATYDDGVKYSPGRQDASTGVGCDGVTCPTDGEVGGNQLARGSKEQASIGINVQQDLDSGWLLTGRLDANYQSKQFLTPLNLGWVPARTVMNLSLNALGPNDHWDISFWGKNITDENYPASAFVIGVFNQYMVGMGSRRSFGATIKYTYF